MFERRTIPPWGLSGGADGAPFRVTLRSADGERPVLGKQTLTLRRGDLVLVETCGGGGYGPPAEREPDRRDADRREGYAG
jgi:N-methylhydantoinase B